MKPINRFVLTTTCVLASMILQAQVIFKITGLPDDTPLEDRVFLAGNFNNWNPGDPALSIDWKDPEQRSITVHPAQTGRLEFKFTRGDWDSAEGNADGGYLPNRTLDYTGLPQTVEVTIQSWEDIGQSNQESTAAPNVYLLDDQFYMPQLDRRRRIQIFLPYSYFGSDRHYPVLYMHDGQNLFDATTSFSGEWQVDETLNQLFETGFPEMIVVAIDNGGSERLNELTPYPNPQYGGGEGDAYVRFIVETLKPHVDRQYRTLAEAANTGIMGSSLGGLISMYAVSRYPETFGKAGVLSPAFWWSDEIYRTASQINVTRPVDIYLLGSELESETMRARLEAMYNTLRSAGVPAENIRLRITADGAHNEWYWARELPEALKWLYRQKTNAPLTRFSDPVLIRANRNNTQLKLEGRRIPDNLRLEITGSNGQVLPANANELKGKRIKRADLPADAAFIKIFSGEQLLNYYQVN